MLSKPQLQIISQLHQKKYRKQYGLFLVEGEKGVAELLKSNIKTEKVYGTSNWLVNNKPLVKHFQFEVITQKQLNQVSLLSSANQVIAIAKLPLVNVTVNTLCNELILVLDGINDPGNLGTLIRTADWFGINNIICSNNTVDAYNPKCVQATMGSLFRSNIAYVDLNHWLQEYKATTKLPIYATSLHGNNVYRTHLNTFGAVVIGSESHGVSNEVIAMANQQITIPAFKENNRAESLNAGIAGALVMAAFRLTPNN
jgi:TrmH family RNA methyltransferase